MKSSECFIMKPMFNNLEESGLHYKDILTYVTIRSFYNIKDKYCYPSYSTIAKRSGLSFKFISESVKRLHAAHFLNLWKFGKSRVMHYYMFPKFDYYQCVPFKLLETKELTVNEKSILMLLREYCNSALQCYTMVTEIAKLSGLTYRVVQKHYKALILKGFIVETLLEDPLDNSLIKVVELTNKLKWDFPNYCHSTPMRVRKEESSGLELVSMVTDIIKNSIRNPVR